MNETVELLSRLQFAATALYHFIFVPLTLGLSVILAIMETIYLKTRNDVWKKMVKYWGLLFGINFAMGVATGITMEFQFGTNWSYYSYYVGDIFGVPLALEGIMAFFLEATFVGLFFLGWKKLTPKQHCTITWLMAIGTNLSAFWILIANGWMQYPAGSHFNPETMRMELSNFSDLLFNSVAQAKFAHTVSAGYVAGAMFVIAISSYFLLSKKAVNFAKRSLAVAAVFGFCSIALTIISGDDSGYQVANTQPMKLASIEATWETSEGASPLNLVAIPDQKNRKNSFEIQIPYVGSIINYHTTERPIVGINDILKENETRIQQGAIAVDALKKIRAENASPEDKANFEAHKKDLGYGLLLRKYTDDPLNATPQQIKQAAESTLLNVSALFNSFHIMFALGVYLGIFFLVWLYLAKFKYQTLENLPRWLLKLSLYSLPVPWICIELGWLVAEYGRQPWAIQDILPTGLSYTSGPSIKVALSLLGFITLYSVMLIVEIKLMVRAIKTGPQES